MSAGIGATVALVVGYLARLAAMWLRLRLRERRDRARLAAMAGLVGDVDADCEIVEQSSDGSWMRLSVTHHSTTRNDHG